MAHFWTKLLSNLKSHNKASVSMPEAYPQHNDDTVMTGHNSSEPEPQQLHELKCDPRLYDDRHSDINWDRLQQLQAEFDFPNQRVQEVEERCIPAEGPSLPIDAVSTCPQCYVVLDVETTGLSPECDHIIEFGAIKVENGEEADYFCTFIDPGYSIPPYITQITGITDADVADAPDLFTAMQGIAAFIGDLPIVAHNATFDLRFLYHAYQQAHLQANFRYIDTLTLARHAFPDAPNHKLSTLIDYLGIDGVQEHRALSDVHFTNQIFRKCTAHIESSAFLLPYPSTRSQRRQQYRAYKRYSARNTTCQKNLVDPSHPLYQKRILFTGTMQIPRHEAAQLAEKCGAILTGSVSTRTDYIVVGTHDISSAGAGGMSTKEKRAHWLNEHEDCHIKIINETEFFALLNQDKKV